MSPSPSQPSLPWRVTSSFIMGATGSLSRAFLLTCSNTEVIGLDRFLQVLDARKDVESRDRGLLTGIFLALIIEEGTCANKHCGKVSNHLSVLDDPLMWGILPFRYAFNPDNHRWSLASHDICFPNKATSVFFSFGQTLPAHRLKHSKYGGLFQPTMTQAIRLLSAQPFSSSEPNPNTTQGTPSLNPQSPDITDPFASGTLTYSTTGSDTFPAPSAYQSRRHSWVHIFPEGSIHQHPSLWMRYFKWGVSRLILESEPLPTIIPIFISGTEKVMHESRKWPRFVPRAGKDITVVIGEQVDGEKLFGDLRNRWKSLVKMQKDSLLKKGEDWNVAMGELTDNLKYAQEAVDLRVEVTRRIRLEVLKVRKESGYPDEDPKASLVETWREEGGKREGGMDDDSWVKEM